MYWRDEQLIRQDGSLFWARITGRLIDPQDPAKGVLGIMEDISVERATIEALREAEEGGRSHHPSQIGLSGQHRAMRSARR